MSQPHHSTLCTAVAHAPTLAHAQPLERRPGGLRCSSQPRARVPQCERGGVPGKSGPSHTVAQPGSSVAPAGSTRGNHPDAVTRRLARPATAHIATATASSSFVRAAGAAVAASGVGGHCAHTRVAQHRCHRRSLKRRAQRCDHWHSNVLVHRTSLAVTTSPAPPHARAWW